MIRRTALLALTALTLLTGPALLGAPALAGPAQPTVVNAVPQAATPDISDGAVYAVAQVGATMVVGGTFSHTDASPGAPLSTPYVMAFDATTGAVRTGFAPALDGIVYALLPGPTPGTVYVGGGFNTVRGTAAKSLVLLNLADGSPVSSFAMPTPDGTVQTVRQVGGHLLVGGTFTKVGGVAHGGLVSLNASTGAPDGYLTSNVAVNHNWTPSSPPGSAKGPVGVFRLAVTPDGTKMVGIGNFKQVDGAVHDQIAMWDLPATGSATMRDWNTTRLQPACLSATFDSYVRDVDFSPDGSYFSLVDVGGQRDGALCDAASRWETAATGPDVQPTWVAYTGQDSLLSTAVTGTAVYVGGHQRWLNNGLGHDTPGPGAVPRPGLAALDPANGLPLAWNPGRNPRGAGAYTLLATSTGLWVGSDTDYIGNKTYRHRKIAFFPLAGGAAPASKAVATLPGEVYQGSVPAAAPTGVLYRINAGGPLLQSSDAGPDWAADTAANSPLRNSGSIATTYGTPVPAVDATVPAGTPKAVFASERVDPGAKGDGGEMQWHLPVPAGTTVDVRVYFADRCACAGTPGSRVFDVSIDGAVRLDHVDAYTAANATGTMRHWSVTSDGSIDIGFIHEVGDPTVSALEVVQGSAAASPAGSLAGRTFDGSTAGPAQPLASPLDVSAVRGATLVGGALFYGDTDGELHRRTTDGRTWGADAVVDPYDDPYWSTVKTGSGGVYRGTRPSFYNEIPNLTSLSYDGTGRLYYTLYRQTGLYYRDFSPDSGIIGVTRSQVPGLILPDVTGAFLAGGNLYFARRSDGTLLRRGFDDTGPTGTATVVSGPATDGIDWRTRVLFLGPVPPGNAAPTASFTASCGGTACSFDGTGSSDADGSITSYAWTFGDGTSGTGATPGHTYAQPGSYPVGLTVTDDGGATATTSSTVVVQGSSIAFHGSSSYRSDTATSLPVPVPGGTQPGDALLLRVTTSGTASDPQAPAGWTEVSRRTAGTALSVVWQRTAVDTSPVVVTLASSIKSNAQLLAYGGVASVSAAASAGDAGVVTDHVAPAVAVAAAGSWVVHLWADKSSSTTTWQLPTGVLRASAYGSGAGYLTAIAADAGASSAAGAAPAAVASTDAASRAAMFSVVLAPS